MRLILPLLLLLLGLAGCAAPDNCALVPLADMPLDLRQNLMFVTAGIAGKPVRLLVDTGAERTVLTEATVARLGLAHDPHHMTRSFGIGGSSANWDADIPGIVLGGTRFPVEHVAVGHFAIDHVNGPQADGLLGADILLAFDMDIDEPAHRLTLYRVRRCPEAVPPWHQAAIRIGGLEARRDRLLVPITLDGVNGMAILDTGAQATVIGMNLAQRLGLSTETLATDRIIMAHGAAPQPEAVHVHRFRGAHPGRRPGRPLRWRRIARRRFPAQPSCLAVLRDIAAVRQRRRHAADRAGSVSDRRRRDLHNRLRFSPGPK
jgi:hypothetical protein